MDAVIITLVIIAVVILATYILIGKKASPAAGPIPDDYRQLLTEHVDFYNKLDDVNKTLFENRVQHFLATTRITGVNTTVAPLDRVFIAAGAIIPIFGFPDWEYINLNEVLLYPDSFNDEFEQQGSGRNTLGVVGTGAYQNIMILSQHELRQGFFNKTGKTNTAIHEFVHLVDKTDGSVDGIPEYFVSRQYVLPWLHLMRVEIKKIMANRSDINPYGATNEAEFFAVVAEYFFERPDLLQTKHPELYELLVTIFRQQTSPPSPLSKGEGA
jgi:MtfA peptidase